MCFEQILCSELIISWTDDCTISKINRKLTRHSVFIPNYNSRQQSGKRWCYILNTRLEECLIIDLWKNSDGTLISCLVVLLVYQPSIKTKNEWYINIHYIPLSIAIWNYNKYNGSCYYFSNEKFENLYLAKAISL